MPEKWPDNKAKMSPHLRTGLQISNIGECSPARQQGDDFSIISEPSAVRATRPSSIVSPHSTISIRRSTRASSQTECRGHVLRQASIASAYVLGRVEIQVRSSRFNGSGIASHDRALLRAKSSPKVIK